MPMASRTTRLIGVVARSSAAASCDLKCTALAYQSGVANRTTSTPGTWTAFASLLSGTQLVVPGIMPSTCSFGRALSRVRSRIASPTATAMPCSTPIRTTASSVTTASPSSSVSNRAIEERSRTRTIRAAT